MPGSKDRVRHGLPALRNSFRGRRRTGGERPGDAAEHAAPFRSKPREEPRGPRILTFPRDNKGAVSGLGVSLAGPEFGTLGPQEPHEAADRVVPGQVPCGGIDEAGQAVEGAALPGGLGTVAPAHVGRGRPDPGHGVRLLTGLKGGELRLALMWLQRGVAAIS
jgi:hypothetical protein